MSAAALPRRDLRTGFTVVELLVVISIIAVLMGLLLPAVQSARESGRRTQCTNNLYQMALAANQFDQARGYAPGWRNPSPNPADTTGTGQSTQYLRPSTWTVPLLNYMERKDVFNSWSGGVGPLYIQTFVCPSSPPPSTKDSFLSYAGNAGSAAQLSPNQNPADGVMLDVVPRWNNLQSRLVRISQSFDGISEADGTATTMLLLEKCGPAVPEGTLRWDGSMNNLTAQSAINQDFSWPTAAIVGMLENPGSLSKVVNSPVWAPAGAQSLPSSNHPGGAVVAFCDGHTGFLKDTITPQVYAQLMTSNNVASTTWIKAQGSLGVPWNTGPYVLNQGDYQ
jgi:prepilin-type N-terminal cleavage/methylation domain-containing protein/prepilin-type processing-associated H-X9-DG protein